MSESNGLSKADLAQSYKVAFDGTKSGQDVLDDLVSRFGGNPYRRGGLEAQRETDYRAGRLTVIDHILHMLNLADDPQKLNEGDSDVPQ